MKQISKNIKVFAVICCLITIIGYCVIPKQVEALSCEHVNVVDKVCNESTCAVNGTTNQSCAACGEIVLIVKSEKLAHDLSPYTITVPASENRDGVQEATCSACGYVDSIPYICGHYKLYEVETDATCLENGRIDSVCLECSTIVESEQTDALGHGWSDWKIVKYALPDVSGTKEQTCYRCGEKETSSYVFTMARNAIYVPNTDINASFVPCGLSQDSVDRYDLVYDTSYFGVAGPWILGHNYGTLRHLPQVKVGQTIYLSVNGQIQKYRVIISEFAMQNESWTDIIGQSSGYSIFDDMGGTTLRMYTCYGGKNGRWVVFANKY